MAPLLTLGAISEVSGGGMMVTITNAGAILVNAAISAGAGAVFLTATGVNGSISETPLTGSVGANSLTTSSVIGTTLNGANTVSNYAASNTMSNNMC
jgi:hypothetical protein